MSILNVKVAVIYFHVETFTFSGVILIKIADRVTLLECRSRKTESSRWCSDGLRRLVTVMASTCRLVFSSSEGSCDESGETHLTFGTLRLEVQKNPETNHSAVLERGVFGIWAAKTLPPPGLRHGAKVTGLTGKTRSFSLMMQLSPLGWCFISSTWIFFPFIQMRV